MFRQETTRRSIAYGIIVSLAVFAMTAPSFAQSDKPNVQQAVEAFVTKFQDTYNKKDAAALAALYMDDAILVPPGPIATGKPSIQKTWQAVLDAGRTGLKYTVKDVRAQGDLVWSVGQFSVMSPDDKDTPQERPGNFVHFYQWQGKELKLRVHAFTFLPAAPPK
jgi:uncharacterized protein (TIGR02246 family)